MSITIGQRSAGHGAGLSSGIADKVATFVEDVTADSVNAAQDDATQALANAAAAQSTADTAASNITTLQTLVAGSPHERVFTSPLGRSLGGGSSAAQSGVAYWVYLKKLTANVTVKGISLCIGGVPGVGTQTAEFALASTTLPPNRSAQVLTKIWGASASFVSGDLTSASGTNLHMNLSQDITAAPGAPVYLWVGFRQAMSSTQAQLVSLAGDFKDGLILATASAGALTGNGPWTGAIHTSGSNGAQSPDIHVTLD